MRLTCENSMHEQPIRTTGGSASARGIPVGAAIGGVGCVADGARRHRSRVSALVDQRPGVARVGASADRTWTKPGGRSARRDAVGPGLWRSLMADQPEPEPESEPE